MAKRCTAPKKCSIFTKFCNEPNPWMSVKKRERESRGEGRAITHCGVIALPYTPGCVLFGFSIFPFYLKIHLILSYGFYKMLPLDRKHRKGPAKLPLTWIPLSQLLSESQNKSCSTCIKLTIVICSVRGLTVHPVTAHIWQFPRQGYTHHSIMWGIFSAIVFVPSNSMGK